MCWCPGIAHRLSRIGPFYYWGAKKIYIYFQNFIIASFFGIRLLRGGKYAYHGAKGCAFGPPLAYPATPGRRLARPPLIGKVMRHADADAEYQLAERLRWTDPRSQYGIYPAPPVHVTQAEAADSAGGREELERCGPNEAVRALLDGREPDLPPPDQAYQLIMQRALGDVLVVLHPLRTQAPTLARVHAHMRALRNLYAGLEHMHAHELCHLDVKPENCVILGASLEAPEAYKFIDFGLTMSYTELFASAPGSGLLLQHVYKPYPILMSMIWREFPEAAVGMAMFDDHDDGGGAVEFENDIFQTQARSARQRNRRDDIVSRLQEYRRLEPFDWWEPRCDPPSAATLFGDYAEMLYAYGAEGATGAAARVVAARAADVFGLARVTAYVYACVAHIAFRRRGEIEGDPLPLGLGMFTVALGTLIQDMMSMRVKDDAILARFDRVLQLLPLPLPRLF